MEHNTITRFGKRSNLLLLTEILVISALVGACFSIDTFFSYSSADTPSQLLKYLARISIFSCMIAVIVISRIRGYRQKKKFESEVVSLNVELLQANEDMAALNEELRASNEELLSSNERLLAVNEDLSKAYYTISQQKDEQLNRVLESCNDVIWSMDLTGKRESYLSRSAETVYGEPVEKLVERPKFWLEHLYKADEDVKAASQRRLEEVGRTECTYRIELAGSIRWIHDRLKLIRDEAGKPIRIDGIASDVTALKESEGKIKAEHNLLRMIVDNIPDNIFVVDRESRNVINNRSAYRLGATDEEATLGKNAVDYFGENGTELIEDNQRIFETGIPILNKEISLRVGNQTKTMLNSKVPLRNEQGDIIGLIGITRDITERVQQNDELNQYRRNLEIVFDNSSDNFMLLDEHARLVLFNKRFKQFSDTFVNVKPVVGMSLYEVIPAERIAENKDAFDRALRGESILSLGHFEKEGESYYFDVRYNPVVQDGVVRYVTISALNITEQKRLELLATRHRENLDIIFQTSTDFFILLNVRTEIVLFNKSFLEYTRDSVQKLAYLGMSYYEIISPNRIELVKDLVSRCMQGEKITTIGDAVWPTGTRTFSICYTPVFKDGVVTHITVSSTDITEQKKQEVIATKYRENLDIVFNNTSDQFELIEADGTIALFNQAFSDEMQRVFGKHPVIGMQYSDLVPLRRKQIAQSIFERVLTGETVETMAEIPFNGGTKYFRIQVTPVFKNGTVTHICRTGTDITEKVNQNVTLTKYRENLDMIFANTNDHFVLIEASAKVIFFNSKFSQFVQDTLQFTPVPGMLFTDFVPPDRRRAALTMWAKALAGESASDEADMLTSRGRVYYDVRYVPVFHDGVVTHVSFSAVDMTQRRNQEMLINQYRQNLSIIFENTSDYFLLLDKSAIVILFNHKFMNFAEETLGFTPREGMTFTDIVSPDSTGLAQSIFAKAIAGESTNNEVSIETANGPRYFDIRCNPVIQDNSVTHVCLNATEITDRKNRELELNAYRENIEIIFSNSTDCFLLIDSLGKVILFNRAFEHIIGSVSGIIPSEGMNFQDIVVPERREISAALFQKALLGESVAVEAAFVTLSNKKLQQLLRYEPVLHNGHVTHVSISAIDITENKEKEIQLMNSEASLKSILDSTLDGFLLLNDQYQIVLSNVAYHNMMAMLKDDLTVGKSILDILPLERSMELKSYLEKVKAGEFVRYEVEQSDNQERKWISKSLTPVMTSQNVFFGYCISAHDITKQKLADNLVRESEERYKALIENGIDVTSIVDFSGNVLFNSSNLVRVLGYDNINGDYANVIHPDDLVIIQQGISAIAEAPGKSFPSVIRVLHKNGEWRWMEGMSTNLSHVPSVRGIVSTHHDITDRKRIEEELKRNQYFLEKASETAKIGYWTSESDPENGRLTWSKEVFSIFEMSESEFDGKNSTFFQFIHPDDRARAKELSRIAVQTNQVYHLDHRIVLRNGRIKWMNQQAQVIPAHGDVPALMVGIVQDISDRKLIEEVLREYNDRHAILSKATNDVIWDWNILNDRIVYNYAMFSVLGYQENEIKSNRSWWEERIHPDDHDRIQKEIDEVFKKNLSTREFTYRYLTASGLYRYIRDRVYFIYNEDGKAVRMIGAMQDVNELTEYRISLEMKVKERTEKLNAALQKEKELVEMKSRFVSIASHEFRTPISTILLASGFIRRFKERLTPEQIDAKLNSVETQAKHMSVLLEDILTIGKSDAGKMSVVITAIKIQPYLENLINEVAENTNSAHRINVRYECNIDTFPSDDRLMRNIIINLLTNAIKFSKESDAIDVLLTCNSEHVCFKIRDYGTGIPKEDISRLFEAFFRAGNVANISGTGLGLSIVKNAVELLKGQITVESEIGVGTEFTVNLPILPESSFEASVTNDN